MTPSNHRTRPSISSWISRSSLLSSNAPTSATAVSTRAISISDPIPDSRNSRMGPLGQGATLVTTPQEALSRSGLNDFPSDILEEEPEVDSQSSGSKVDERRQSFAHSIASGSQDRRSSYSRRSFASVPPSPNRRAYSRPATPPPPVPPLPVEAFLPSFNPIVLEFHPENVMEWSQTIVVLETSTSTHKTTWSTLMNYPSNLSRYLQSLLQQIAESVTTDNSAAEAQDAKGTPSHLGAHIFLDRPSTSYSHIVHYLRTPPATPTSLPWAIQLESSPSARIESLLALRDEAKYLDLELLYRLCCSELGLDCIPSPNSTSFPSIEETPRENIRQRKKVVSAATTAVESPIIPTSSIVLDDYFPSAAILKSRTRSNSRSSKVPPIPPPKVESGWI